MSIDSQDKNDNKGKQFSIQKAHITIGLIVISLVCIVFILSKYVGGDSLFQGLLNQNKSSTKDVVSASDIIDISSYTEIKNAGKDSNADGIANWQQVIVDADPSLKDNFVDIGKIKDGQAGNANSKDINYAQEKIDNNSNFTVLVSRDLYVAGQYKNKDEGIDLSAVNTELIKNLKTLLSPVKLQIVNIRSTSSSKDIKKFFNDLAILLIYMRTSDQVELQEYISAANSEVYDFPKTKSYLGRLEALCKYYKALPTPKEYSELLVETIYACEKYSIILRAMTSIQDDPVKSQIAFAMYKENHDKIYGTLKYTANKVKSLNIKYVKTDPASVYYMVN